MSVHPASFKVNDDILPCCKIKQKIRKEKKSEKDDCTVFLLNFQSHFILFSIHFPRC